MTEMMALMQGRFANVPDLASRV